jgi:hypothetical protein
MSELKDVTRIPSEPYKASARAKEMYDYKMAGVRRARKSKTLRKLVKGASPR